MSPHNTYASLTNRSLPPPRSTQSKEIFEGYGLPLANLQIRRTDMSYPLVFGINRQEFSTFYLKSGEPQKNLKTSSGS